MTPCEEIREKSDDRQIICGVVDGAMSALEVARTFGLAEDPRIYVEVDERVAKAGLLRVLYCDLAYDAPMILLKDAERLTVEFLAQFGRSRYFTNREMWLRPDGKLEMSNQWSTAMPGTFDAGFIVCGEALSGCFWVSDED